MDLYMYYTTIALGMSSPSLRAAAISVLVLLVPQDPVHGASVCLVVCCLFSLHQNSDIFLSSFLLHTPFFHTHTCTGSELLKGIQELASGDTWWEVRVQIIVLAATLLGCLPADDESNISVPLSILDENFTIDAPLSVKKAGLSYIASTLRLHPHLIRRYVNVLMSLPSNEMASLLKMDTT